MSNNYLTRNVEYLLFFLFSLTILFHGLTAFSPFPIAIFHLFSVICCVLLLGFYLLTKNPLVVTRDFALVITAIVFFTMVTSVRSYLPIKNVINILIFVLCSYLFVTMFPVRKLLVFYKNLVCLLVFFSFLQLILYYTGFSSAFYNFDFLGRNGIASTSGVFFRVTSLASEPANLVKILAPALGFSIAHIMGYKEVKEFWGKYVSYGVIIAFLFTWSSVGYIYVIIFSLYFVFISNQVKWVYKFYVLILGSVFIIFSFSSDEISSRIDALVNLSENSDSIANLSVFALASNLFVMNEVISQYPFFGAGLFSHATSYDVHVYSYFSFEDVRMELNKDDASSLYIRVLSEFGVVGFLCLYFYLLLKIKRSVKYNLIVPSLLCISFLCYSLRSGDLNNTYIWFLFFLISKSYRYYRF